MAKLLTYGKWTALLALGGCVENYAPDVVSAPNAYLVVDGFLNGAGRTRLHLSRSTNIATTTAPPAEKGARVLIQDEAGQRYSLSEVSPGYYVSDSLTLNPARRYQLRLTTAAKIDYASDLVALKVTPAIDKVNYQVLADEVNLTVSTHDPAAQSRYYRWRLAETWEFNSAFKSVIEYRGGVIRPRIVPIYTCWRTEIPSGVLQRSTASLSQDAVADFQLLSFSDHAERVAIRYSLQVVQYAETAEEFAYNEILRKNTEAVGTVNDPLPSQLTGNVHRLDNPAEPVLGFVGAHTQVVQRIFVTPQSLGLPIGWAFDSPYADCLGQEGLEKVPDPDDKNPIYPPHTRLFSDPGSLPTYPDISNGDTIGYFGARAYCVDCRQRGSLARPSFW